MYRQGSTPRRSLASLQGLSAAAICALLGGCAPELPTPTITAVDPEFGYSGEDNPIDVFGSNLFPAMGARPSGEVDWDREIEAWLDGEDGSSQRLSGVSLVSYEKIQATVPEGLDPGYYDLRVLTPSGDEVRLPHAYEVTSTRVDHLSLVIDRPSLDIGEYAVLEVRALDKDEALVQEDLAVTVELTLDSDTAGVTFSDSPGLDEQESLTGVIGIQGRLDPTGIGYFALTANAQARVSLAVGPTDSGSRVRSDVDTISFDPGPVSQVRVTLLDDEIVAGESFELGVELLDEGGNLAPTTQALLFLHERCSNGTYGETRFVIGQEELQVAVTGATNLDCSANAIEVAGVAEGQTFTGSSEDFVVSPGAASQLYVVASPSSVRAGEDPLLVIVSARDDWGNLVEDHEATLTLTDTAGGLDASLGLGWQQCSEMSAGLAIAFCEARLWTSGAEVSVIARDSARLVGVSNPIEVVAGTLAAVELELSDVIVTAGESFEAVVRPLDDLGNVVEIEPEELGLLSFEDDHGPATCVRSDEDVDLSDGASYDCLLLVADGADALAVSLVTSELSLTDLSAAFAVINGALSFVDIQIDDVDSLQAGDTLEVGFTAYDAYDNLYTTGSDRTLDLWDDSGSLSAVGSATTTVDLDSDAAVSATLLFTTTHSANRVYAGLADATLGESDSFDILAGDLAELDISAAATWTWLDEPLTVTVRALDNWGNLVPSYSEPVTVRSATDLGEDQSSEDWSDGRLSLDFGFDSAGLGDLLVLVQDGSEIASTETLDVLDGDCVSGPTAGLTVAGDAPATLCLSGGTTPLTTVSSLSTVAGTRALAWYHYDLGDGSWSRTSAGSINTRWTEEGGYRVRLVVADRAACGSAASAEVYVAADDGSPAGPVTVSLDDDTLNAGLDSATATLSALDCSGDPANGSLSARVNLGRLEDGDSSELLETGTGLSVEVVDGEADLRWSMVSERYAGPATLRVGAPSGAAYGEVEATVNGDQARPKVLSADPFGTCVEPIDTLTLLFSEAIDADSVDRKPISLSERSGAPVSVGDVALSEDRRTITVTLAESFTPGELVLLVPAELRDDAGNRLNGAWDDGSSPSDFELALGSVSASAPDMTACIADHELFRPDGDDGEGEEDDQVTLQAYADGLPVWWRLAVYDSAGELVYLFRVAADSSSDPLSWEGRGLDGAIVDAGTYDIAVTAEDEFWNIGTTCTTSVTVAHRVSGIP